ncbi:ABC transporter substrate-binding protein [Microbacterium sp. CFBP9034]|uniref:ABC transporter substrate-binding protein n=1 Tax=Microbacterium sp. CFBP9034 TaxID=3096540 RepID=UPI002A6A62C7|nr:extracellular solute-binding protein [Microbacterium sp. CFBP9034]MDY0908483.1 extracellular solute-binding protein [Microbacterium sp. CFBP9034]
MNTSTPATFSRRGFLGIAAAAAAVPLLAACAPGGGGGAATGGGGSGTLKFWDMPWGPQSYADAAKAVTTGYSPASGLPSASYQQIQWNNFYQTFSSAIASKTGPAVSSGAGFQAFQFAEQGAIAYADDLIESMRKSGKLDDFLPGTVETMKTPDGYAAIPWQADYRVLWYRKSLLEQAGVDVPTDWASYIEASKALAKTGVYGFGIGAGAGNSIGSQALISLMINNGGGLFDTDQKPDAVTDANIEAMDFVRELIAVKAVDPGAPSYTADNIIEQWKTKRIGMGWHTAGLQHLVNDDDVVVASPLTAYSGGTGTLGYVNNLMMYTNTPSQEGSEAFLTAYLDDMKMYWDNKLIDSLPVLKSIVDSEAFQSDAEWVKIIDQWQPVVKPLSYQAETLFADLAAVDGGQGLQQFTQAILGGQTDSKTALEGLQVELESATS